MNKQTVPANFEIGDDEELLISKSKRGRWIIPFKPFGTMDSRLPESLDAVCHIAEFSKAELFLFREVMRHKADNNDVRIRKKAYSTAEQAKLEKAIREWISKDLLFRHKREHYMVNPWFAVPQKKKLHLETITRWRELKTT